MILSILATPYLNEGGGTFVVQIPQALTPFNSSNWAAKWRYAAVTLSPSFLAIIWKLNH